MRDKWVSKEYEQEQYLKLTHLSQDNGMSVEEYMKEFEKLCLICDLQEKETFKIARFVKGLSKGICRKVEVTHYATFNDVCKLALKYEAQAKEEKEKERPKTSSFKSNSKFTPFTSNESNFQRETFPNSSSSSKFDKGKEKQVVSPSELATRRKCFKCHGRGHIASECPSKTVLTATQCAIMDEEEQMYNFVTREEESNGEDDFEEEISPESDHNLLVVRKILLGDPQVDERQRNNLFHTRCKIGEKTCNVIVDSGAQIDVISSEAVSKLKLHTRVHDEPYKLNWLNDGTNMRVKKQALVTYSIGGFKDERWCDILPMDACHLLLGRPWQFDHDSVHKCKSNVFIVTTKDGRKFKLLPLPPKVARKEKEKSNYLVICTELEKIVEEMGEGYTLVGKAKDEICISHNNSSPLNELLGEYKYVFPNDLSNSLPSNRCIDHVIPRVPLPHNAICHQMKLKGGNKWKTASKTKQGLYEWLKKMLKRGCVQVNHKIDLRSATFNIRDLSPYLEDASLGSNFFQEGENDPRSRSPLRSVVDQEPIALILETLRFYPFPKRAEIL